MRAIRMTVEGWSNDYGTPVDLIEDDGLPPSHRPVDETREVPTGRWAPLRPSGSPVADNAFVDGTMRQDGVAWTIDEDGGAHRTTLVAFAAGAVLCSPSAARVDEGSVVVRRASLSTFAAVPVVAAGGCEWTPATLAGKDGSEAVRSAMFASMLRMESDVLGDVARRVPEGTLLFRDGELRAGGDTASLRGDTVGVVKTLRRDYLAGKPEPVRDTLRMLAPCERTPLLHFGGDSPGAVWSWYVRLPAPRPMAHSFDHLVRCEASPSLSTGEAHELADRATLTLPRFAADRGTDPRAPQNLLPVAGLEKTLRHRLGDPQVVSRLLAAAVRVASADL